MSIKLIHFREQNQGISFFEGCSSDINTIAREILFNLPSEISITAAFHEIFIKQKNIICIFNSETKSCLLAAIYLDQNDCDDDFRFVKRKANNKLQIDENQEKNLYKNNFILFLIGMLIDQPLSFGSALKNVITEILGLALPVPIVGVTKPANSIPSPVVGYPMITNIETPPPKILTREQSLSPTASIDLPLLSSGKNSSTSLFTSNREKPMNAPIGILKHNGQGSDSRSKSNVNSSSLIPGISRCPAFDFGPSLISRNNINVDDIITDFAMKQPRTPPAPVKRAPRSRTTINNNNINKAPSQRKRMRSNDFGWGENIGFGSNDLESSVANNTPKRKKISFQPTAQSQSNDKAIRLPNYFFKNVLTQNGRKTSTHLFIMAPNSNSLAYEYEAKNESKGEYRCIKCFKNNKKTVSAKFNFQLEECTLGRIEHLCEPQICERESSDTSR